MGVGPISRWWRPWLWATPRPWCSLLGLGTLLTTSAFWFTVVKLVGGMYLLYLGIELLRAGVSPMQAAATAAASSYWRLIANHVARHGAQSQGHRVLCGVPAAVHQFERPVTQQLWVLAATFVALATVNVTLHAVFATSARKVLSSPRSQRGFNLAGGSLLSAAGVWALLAKRPA